MTNKARGFTLVELLVVVAIIVVLLALLLPGMDRALSAAEKARCGANEKGAGNALVLYLGDFKRTYPMLMNWGMLMGNLGATGHYGGNTNDVNARPLNAYLGVTGNGGRVSIAECPSDAGDPHRDLQVPSAYQAFGTSYLGAEFGDYSRAKMVFGGHPSGVAPTAAVRQSQLSPAHNKLLIADWPWHANRPTTDPKGQWHATDASRSYNALFADSHVAFLDLDDHPAGPLGSPPPDGDLFGKPNRSAAWW